MTKTYKELISFSTFEERLSYLSSVKQVGAIGFGHTRYLNQSFYRSVEWKRIRSIVIARDNGCDLACYGHEIHDFVIIHHMNPLTAYDIENLTEYLIDPEYLITVSKRTHQIIHYGGTLEDPLFERKLNDHILW